MTATLEKTETYADSIRALAKKHGKVTPKIVLNDAKRANSPLHSFFDWNDSAAAIKYRLQQAQDLIRSIRVTYTPYENETVKIRVREFVSVTPESKDTDEKAASIYIPYTEAMKVESYRDQVMYQCKRDAESFRQKYRSLQEAAAIIEAMDGFILHTEA